MPAVPVSFPHSWQRWTLAVLLAALLNMALFLLLPLLLRTKEVLPEFRNIVPSVQLVHMGQETAAAAPKAAAPPPPMPAQEEALPKKPEKQEVPPVKLSEAATNNRELQLNKRTEEQKKPVKKPKEKKEKPMPAPKAVPPRPAEPEAPHTQASTTDSTAEGSASSKQLNGNAPSAGGMQEVSASQLDHALVATRRSPPEYPGRARRKDIEGWVKVRFLVDERGQVSRIKVLAAEPGDMFNQSVIDCVGKWQFKPGTLQGIPVRAWAEQTIRFQLK